MFEDSATTATRSRTRRIRRRLIPCTILIALIAAGCASDESASTTTAGDDGQTPVFVGSFGISPAAGPIGTVVTATGSGFDPNATLTVAWEDTTATWNVNMVDGTFHGREFVTEPKPLVEVTTDADGAFETEFTVPEDFGFTHNVTVQRGDDMLNRAAFRTDMEMSISPASGPPGTPITIEVRGISRTPGS